MTTSRQIRPIFSSGPPPATRSFPALPWQTRSTARFRRHTEDPWVYNSRRFRHRAAPNYRHNSRRSSSSSSSRINTETYFVLWKSLVIGWPPSGDVIGGAMEPATSSRPRDSKLPAWRIQKVAISEKVCVLKLGNFLILLVPACCSRITCCGRPWFEMGRTATVFPISATLLGSPTGPWSPSPSPLLLSPPQPAPLGGGGRVV